MVKKAFVTVLIVSLILGLLISSNLLLAIANDNGIKSSDGKRAAASQAPTNLQAYACDNKAILYWEAPSDASAIVGYYIYRSTVSGGSKVDRAFDSAVKVTSFIDKNVKNGTTYYYTVKALYGDSSEGPASEEVSVTPKKPKSTVIVLKINSSIMTVNGVSQEIDPGRNTRPIIMRGRTLIPIRAIIETIGGKVAWDQVSQKATIALNGKTIDLYIGNSVTTLNGVPIKIDVAPIIKNGRSMLPLRFISEKLGVDVKWDQATKTITMTLVSQESSASESIFDNWNGYAVQNKPKKPTTFTITRPRRITNISTYHWNNGKGMSVPGSISIAREDGIVYGPWQAIGVEGQGGAPNVGWYVNDISQDIPAGTYTVNDSSPETWSHNTKSDGCGFTKISAKQVTCSDLTTITSSALTSGESVDWTGVWDIDWGRMILTQTGDTVTGSYTTEGSEVANGKITGTITDMKLTGEWAESPSYRNYETGEFEFTLADDGQSFTGKFGHYGDKHQSSASIAQISLNGTLNGVRISLTESVTGSMWTGTWDTNWGRMLLTETRDGITGIYTPKGSISANGRTISRIGIPRTGKSGTNTIVGRWSEYPSDKRYITGEIEFTLADDGQSFTGHFTVEHDNFVLPNPSGSNDWSGGWSGTKVNSEGLVKVDPKSDVWTGTWDTNWGRMELTETQRDGITGTYTTRGFAAPNGRIIFGGSVSGYYSGPLRARYGDMVFDGQWSEEPTNRHHEGKAAGVFTFFMADDGRSFTGRWRTTTPYTGGVITWNSWSGVKVR